MHVNWDSIQNMCESLSKKIIEYNVIKFDCILCLGRGAMIPSRLLSEYLGIKNVSYLEIGSLYVGQASIGQIKVEPCQKNFSNLNVLMVDECMTTGTTFEKAKKAITSNRMTKPKELGFACIFVNKNIQSKPSFYCNEYDAMSTWIVFPWENGV